MKCQAPNRRGSLGNALVDKLIGFIAAAAWLWVLSQLIVGLATASAWKLAGAIAVAVAGFAYLAYAAARARTRVRHEAYSSRVKRECDRLIAERDAIVIERDTLARKLKNRDQQAGELIDALERAARDLVVWKANASPHIEHNRELSLREALELLDLIDRHTYTGDDGAEWQVTAFREKRTDAFAYKAAPVLVLGKERLEAAPDGAIEFSDSLIAAVDQQKREAQNRERTTLVDSLIDTQQLKGEQVLRQLHMSGADAEEDATGN